jgi:hypothetical protein
MSGPNSDVKIAVLDAIRKIDQTMSIQKANEIAAEVAKEPIYFQDKWFYRSVAIGLVAIVLIVVIGCLAILYNDKDISDALIALGSAAVGGLVGIFATNK